MSKTNMRWFTIPKPQKIIKQTVNTQTGDIVKTFDPEELDYFQYLEDNVWIDSFWRESRDNADALERLQDIFDEARKRYKSSINVPIVVKMSEDDYQKLVPIATMKGKPLQGINGRAYTRLANAILYAVSKNPDKETDEPEEKSAGESDPAG